MIIIVTANSGRCGTSLCMQMLQAAGMPIYWDRLPNRTIINPFGHYEVVRNWWDEKQAPRLLKRAEGKAMKVFWSKFNWLSPDHEYRFIELQRDPQSMFDSQSVMLKEENRMYELPHRSVDTLSLRRDALHTWLQGKDHITLQFQQLFNGEAAEQLTKFLKLRHPKLSIRKMKDACEPSLWHFKPEETNALPR